MQAYLPGNPEKGPLVILPVLDSTYPDSKLFIPPLNSLFAEIIAPMARVAPIDSELRSLNARRAAIGVISGIDPLQHTDAVNG